MKFSGMAFQMGITIFVGVYIGLFLDEKYPNENQIYTVLFTFIFVILALYSVVKKILNDQKKG
jgi:F0F1-type ATP synthase assembly protein I